MANNNSRYVKPYTNQVTVNGLTKIYDENSNPPVGAFPTYFHVVVKALSGTVYLGGDENVTTDTGFPLGVNETVYLPMTKLDDIYAIGSGKIAYWARFSQDAPKRW